MKEWLNDFKKMELFTQLEDDTRLEEDFKTLDKIFTSNNAKNKHQAEGLYSVYNQGVVLGKENYHEVAFAIRDKHINIYKHTFKRPIDPTEEELKGLNELGKFKLERTGLLYWWAKCYARSRSIEIEPYYDSFLLLDDVFLRCGELTGDKLYNLMIGQKLENNQLIVFPFVDLKGEELYKTITDIECYRIEFEKEYLKSLNDKQQKEIDRIVMSISF